MRCSLFGVVLAAVCKHFCLMSCDATKSATFQAQMVMLHYEFTVVSSACPLVAHTARACKAEAHLAAAELSVFPVACHVVFARALCRQMQHRFSCCNMLIIELMFSFLCLAQASVVAVYL